MSTAAFGSGFRRARSRVPSRGRGVALVLLLLVALSSTAASQEEVTLVCDNQRPENLKEERPDNFGRILGLDRAPEVKTLRRKLTRLAAVGGAPEFGRSLAERRVALRGAALVTAISGSITVSAACRRRTRPCNLAGDKIPQSTDYFPLPWRARPAPGPAVFQGLALVCLHWPLHSSAQKLEEIGHGHNAAKTFTVEDWKTAHAVTAHQIRRLAERGCRFRADSPMSHEITDSPVCSQRGATGAAQVPPGDDTDDLAALDHGEVVNSTVAHSPPRIFSLIAGSRSLNVRGHDLFKTHVNNPPSIKWTKVQTIFRAVSGPRRGWWEYVARKLDCHAIDWRHISAAARGGKLVMPVGSTPRLQRLVPLSGAEGWKEPEAERSPGTGVVKSRHSVVAGGPMEVKEV